MNIRWEFLRIIFLLALLKFPVTANCGEGIFKTDLNSYKMTFETDSVPKIIPHGFIDQAKESIIVLYGEDKLISSEHSFSIGSFNCGYTAYSVPAGVELYLITCSEKNDCYIIVTGTCRKDEWERELIKLIGLSVEKIRTTNGNYNK